MKDWKYKQQLYHLQTEIEDDINTKKCIIREDRSQLSNHIIFYFNQESDILSYPSKSYAVAIIYAKLLEQYFNEDFYEVLNDPDLLYGNDKYFVPYSQDKDIYDEAISNIDLSFKDAPSQVNITIDFFEKEFFINIYKINLREN